MPHALKAILVAMKSLFILIIASNKSLSEKLMASLHVDIEVFFIIIAW